MHHLKRTTGAWTVLLLSFVVGAASAVPMPPNFSIHTQAEWAAEIGPGGHIRPVLTSEWDDFGFELLYPGQQGKYYEPTLSTVEGATDAYGEDALELTVSAQPDAEVITAWVYEYPVDPSYKGVKLNFSVLQGLDAAKWSVHLVGPDRLLNPPFKRVYSGDVPAKDPTLSGPKQWTWVNLDIDTATYDSQTSDFDIDNVTRVIFDYNGHIKIGSKVRFNHAEAVPEPASLAFLLSAGVLLLRRRRAVL